MRASSDLLDLVRASRRSAGDRRKIFLGLYGLLAFVPVALFLVAVGRWALGTELSEAVTETFLRPVLGLVEFVRTCLTEGRFGLFGLILLAVWTAGALVASFFSLTVTRMAAVELTRGRRPQMDEALRFARGHWHWAFLTPTVLLCGAALLTAAGGFLLASGRITPWLLVVAVPAAFLLLVGASYLVVGLLSGGMLAGPTIATEWSDAFDAVSRVYGYGFGHPFRLLLYRVGGTVVLLLAAVGRLLRIGVTLGLLYVALVAALGSERTRELLHSVLLEAPDGLPLPQTLAAWTILLTVAAYLTASLARLLVLRVVLRQAIYLLLRRHVDKVALDQMDGYRPDDSSYDPTAQGFELVEVEEEVSAE